MTSNEHDVRRAPEGAVAAGGGRVSAIPQDVDGASWAALEPLYDELLARPVTSCEALETWLLDRGDLDASASEGRANLFITMTCHTDDEQAVGAWTTYLDEVAPKLKPKSFELDKRQCALFEQIGLGAGSDSMPRERYGLLDKRTRREVDLFRDENVPIETEIAKLDQKYDAIIGAMTVEFNGEERTLPQMAKYMQETDREIRESAWRATTVRRLQDKDAIDDIFQQMIDRRQMIASNAGYKNYRDYQHDAHLRFDYRPEDCFAFHEGVEQHVVPFLRGLDARRRERLGVSPLRPWDEGVDELGRSPLRPITDGQDLIDKSRRVFESLDNELAQMYAGLGDDVTKPGGGANFDLNSRKGKAPGGYQYMRERSGRPFIFMNAAGVHRDVETMVHEAGHAFHSLLCEQEPLRPYRDYPIEFAEVASMSMELLSMPHWDAYYPNEEDANRARRAQLEGSLSVLAWIATIDAFQHWVYTNEAHSQAQRQAAWLDIFRRFGHELSWEGLEAQEDWHWQRQSHLFGNPFYYIEYGIAQLGALGLWLIAKERGPAEAIKLYKRALTLGGSRPLPELFATADLPFDFGPQTIGRIVEAVKVELATLPD